MATQTQTTKPYKVGDEKFITIHIPGSPYIIGDRVSIFSVTNNGTKKNPIFRYYVRGAWYDHDALSTSNPVEGQVHS